MLVENLWIACLFSKVVCVNLFSKLKSISSRARNRYGLGFGNFNICVLYYIVYFVCNHVRNALVVENDFVFTKRERNLLGCFIGNVASNSWSVLCYLLIWPECRIRHNLVRQNGVRRILLVIMHGVADGILRPVRVEGDVLGHRLVPVVRRTGLVGRGVPSLEGVVCLRGIIRRRSIEAVLFCLRFNLRSALGIVSHRTGREREVAVESKTCGHLRSARVGVGILVLRVGKPSKPSRSRHRICRNIIC